MRYYKYNEATSQYASIYKHEEDTDTWHFYHWSNVWILSPGPPDKTQLEKYLTEITEKEAFIDIL